MIQENILELVKYGLSTGLVDPEDKVYTINRLLELFQVDEIEDAVFEKVENLPVWTQEEAEGKLEGILAEMMDYAYENGLMAENSIVYKDLFDTKIMGCLVPEPSSVRKTFRDLYEHTSPLAATDYFYKLSCDSNYIRRQRIKKDRKWTTDTEFGTLDITINLSKPEKDPKAIAAAKMQKQSAYPKCQLCKENEGYAGRVNHPARQNHRIIPLTINHSDWFFQYSPYVYYNEHCIVFNSKHTPMKIERATFGKLENIRMKRHLSMPTPITSLITPSLPLQEREETSSNWIWCCVTISPQRSIRWESIIPMQSCIISKKRISA